MSLLEQIAQLYAQEQAIQFFIAPPILCSIAYFFFKRRDELSYHAIQNTAATVIVVGLNYAAMIWFVEDINGYAQWAYNGLGIPTLPHDFWAPLPLWLVCIFGIIAKDFADYWSHRVMHTTWLWPTHAAHHSDTHVNAFTTYRIHFLEAIVMALSYIILLTWLQMPGAIPLVILFSHLHGLYVHTNLPFQHGPFKLLIASPAYHRWHHADVKEAYGKNLANMIPAWDVIFGTYYEGGLCQAPMGSLSCGIDDKNPIAIFIYPFRRWATLIRTRIIAPPRQSKTTRQGT